MTVVGFDLLVLRFLEIQKIPKPKNKKIKESKNKREPTFWGPLQVWPMVYILYIGINLAIIMKQYGANASHMCLAVK